MASIEMEVLNENSGSANKGFDDDPSDDDSFDSADDDEEMDFDEFAEIELPSSVKSRKDNANSQSNLKRGKMLGSKNKTQNVQKVVNRSRKDTENSQTNLKKGRILGVKNKNKKGYFLNNLLCVNG